MSSGLPIRLLDVGVICAMLIIGGWADRFAGFMPPGFSWVKQLTTFLGFSMSVSSGAVSIFIYDRRVDYDFDIVNFLFKWRRS